MVWSQDSLERTLDSANAILTNELQAIVSKKYLSIEFYVSNLILPLKGNGKCFHIFTSYPFRKLQHDQYALN